MKQRPNPFHKNQILDTYDISSNQPLSHSNNSTLIEFVRGFQAIETYPRNDFFFHFTSGCNVCNDN